MAAGLPIAISPDAIPGLDGLHWARQKVKVHCVEGVDTKEAQAWRFSVLGSRVGDGLIVNRARLAPFRALRTKALP